MDANETQTCSSDFIFSPKNPEDFQLTKKIFNHIDFQALGVYEVWLFISFLDFYSVLEIQTHAYFRHWKSESNSFSFATSKQNARLLLFWEYRLDRSSECQIWRQGRLRLCSFWKRSWHAYRLLSPPWPKVLVLLSFVKILSSRKLREFCFPPIDEPARFPWIYEGLNEMEKKEAKDKVNDRPTIEADRE